MFNVESYGPARLETAPTSRSSPENAEYDTSHWNTDASRKLGTASLPLDSTIKIPLQDAASCHFLSNWVLLPSPGTNRGIFEFLLPIQKKATPGSPFSLAFKACSLLSLTQQRFDPVIQQHAVSCYVRALAATSIALSRRGVATSDATLATLMLLAMYELQSGSKQGIQGWGCHIFGSMQLMKTRDWKRLDSAIGMGLFVAVRVQLVNDDFTTLMLLRSLTRANRSCLASSKKSSRLRVSNGGVMKRSKTNTPWSGSK